MLVRDNPDSDAIELSTFDSSPTPSQSNQKRSLEVGTVDSLNITGIFVLFLKDTWRKTLEDTLSYYMFSAAAFGALIQMGLAWRQASLDKYQGSSIAKGVVETLSAIGIGVAVLGSFFANSIFATVSPIIFTSVMAFKSASHIGMAIYHSFQWGKAAARGDSERVLQHKGAVIANITGATAGVLAAIAVGFVMVALKPIYAIFGVVAGSIGTGLCIFNRFFSSSSKKVTQEKTKALTAPLLSPVASTLSDTARVHQQFTNKPDSRGTAQADTTHPTSVATTGVVVPSVSPRTSPTQTHRGTVSVTTHGRYRPANVSDSAPTLDAVTIPANSVMPACS